LTIVCLKTSDGIRESQAYVAHELFILAFCTIPGVLFSPSKQIKELSRQVSLQDIIPAVFIRKADG